jgi:predicted PurR-regulated permease PerM
VTPETPVPARSSWAVRALLVVAVVFLLEDAKPLLLPVVIALAFAFVLAGPVRWLRRLGVSEYAGAALVIASVLAVIALLVSLLAEPAAQGWARAPATVHQLLESAQRLRSQAFPAPPPAGRRPGAAASAPPAHDAITEQLATEGVSITRAALGQMLSFIVLASATVFLLYFMLATERWLIARTVEAIPRRRTRALLLSGLRQAQGDIGLFITTMGIISIGLGAATGIALALIGFPNPVLWATTTAVLTFVPYIGPVLVTLALLIAGSMASGTGFEMLVPPGLFLLLHFVESNFISPLLMGHRLRISPVFVFLSVLFWSWLWGIAGAFVAVPLLLALRAVSQRSRRLRLIHIYLDVDAVEGGGAAAADRLGAGSSAGGGRRARLPAASAQASPPPDRRHPEP